MGRCGGCEIISNDLVNLLFNNDNNNNRYSFFDSKIIDGDLISNMREYIWFTEYTIYCIIWFHPNSNSLAIYKSRLKNRYFKT